MVAGASLLPAYGPPLNATDPDLAVSWSKLGDLRVAQGDLAGALEAYGQDLEIAQRLAAADPGNAGWQRDLAVSWERLASVRECIGPQL